jgi:hypothetical protein
MMAKHKISSKLSLVAAFVRENHSNQPKKLSDQTQEPLDEPLMAILYSPEQSAF